MTPGVVCEGSAKCKGWQLADTAEQDFMARKHLRKEMILALSFLCSPAFAEIEATLAFSASDLVF